MANGREAARSLEINKLNAFPFSVTWLDQR